MGTLKFCSHLRQLPAANKCILSTRHACWDGVSGQRQRVPNGVVGNAVATRDPHLPGFNAPAGAEDFLGPQVPRDKVDRAVAEGWCWGIPRTSASFHMSKQSLASTMPFSWSNPQNGPSNAPAP